jgi:hypothetical protein
MSYESREIAKFAATKIRVVRKLPVIKAQRVILVLAVKLSYTSVV